MSRRPLLLLTLLLVAGGALVLVVVTGGPERAPPLPARPEADDRGEAPSDPPPDARPRPPSGSGGCVLYGTVRDGEGAPVAGAVVMVDGGRRTTTSGEHGGYEIAGLAADVPCEVEAYIAGTDVDPPEVEVRFSSAGERRRVDLVVERRDAAILADVRFAKPPEGAGFLEAWVDRSRVAWVSMAPRDALYRIASAPGAEMRLVVRFPGFRFTEVVAHVPGAAETERVVVRLEPSNLPLSGRVLEADGTPAADVVVWAGEERAFDHGVAARTDGDGMFPITHRLMGRWIVAVRKGESASGWLLLTDDTERVELVLADGGVVSGVVRDRDTNRPVAGADVRLIITPDARIGMWSDKTGEDGAYRFGGLPPDTFVWPCLRQNERAEPDEDEAREGMDPLATGAATVLPAGGVFRRDLAAVTKPGTLHVFRLVFPPGAEVPEHVRVRYSWEASSGVGVSSGVRPLDPSDPRMAFFFPPGTYDLDVRTADWSGAVRDLLVYETPGGRSESQIEMNRRTPVRVRIVDAEGRPVARPDVGISVGIVQSGSGTAHGGAKTDEAGVADITKELPHPAALDDESLEVTVSARADGLVVLSNFGPNANLVIPGPELAERMRAAGNRPLVLDVPILEHVTMTVRTLDADGAPVAGVQLLGRPPEEFVDIEAITDADGVARMRVRFDPSVGDPIPVKVLSPFIAGPQNADTGTIVVARARRVHVRFVDGEGSPWPELPIEVYGEIETALDVGWKWTRHTTGADGSLDLALPAGDTKLHFGADEHWSVPLDVPAGATTATARLHRQVRLRVSVTVPEPVRSEDKLLVYVTLEPPWGPSGWQTKARRDRREGDAYTGYLWIPPLPARVRVRSPDDRYEAQAVVPPGTEELHLDLVPRPLHPVVLRFVDVEGRRLANVPVDFAGPIAAHADGARRTDSRGEVRLDVPEGTHDLRSTEVNGRRVSPTAFDAPGTDRVEVEVP